MTEQLTHTNTLLSLPFPYTKCLAHNKNILKTHETARKHSASHTHTHTQNNSQDMAQMFHNILVVQSYPTLCDPMDYTVHGILQARILEWIDFPFSRGSSQPRGQTQVPCISGRFFTSGATREGSDVGMIQISKAKNTKRSSGNGDSMCEKLREYDEPTDGTYKRVIKWKF